MSTVMAGRPTASGRTLPTGSAVKPGDFRGKAVGSEPGDEFLGPGARSYRLAVLHAAGGQKANRAFAVPQAEQPAHAAGVEGLAADQAGAEAVGVRGQQDVLDGAAQRDQAFLGGDFRVVVGTLADDGQC